MFSNLVLFGSGPLAGPTATKNLVIAKIVNNVLVNGRRATLEILVNN